MLTAVKICHLHLSIRPFFEWVIRKIFWTLLDYNVAKACAIPSNSTWFTRPFLLVRGWGLGTRLVLPIRHSTLIVRIQKGLGPTKVDSAIWCCIHWSSLRIFAVGLDHENMPFYGTRQLFTFVFCFFHKQKSLRTNQSCPFVAYSSCIPRLTSTHSASNALGFFVTLSSSKVLKSFNRVFSTSYSHTSLLAFHAHCSLELFVYWSLPLGIHLSDFLDVLSYQCFCPWMRVFTNLRAFVVLLEECMTWEIGVEISLEINIPFAVGFRSPILGMSELRTSENVCCGGGNCIPKLTLQVCKVVLTACWHSPHYDTSNIAHGIDHLRWRLWCVFHR